MFRRNHHLSAITTAIAFMLAFTALLAALPVFASASTITVTTTADEFDENPAACSLREAVESANTDANALADGCNAGSGTDTILVRPGVLRLDIPTPSPAPAVDTNAFDDLDITAPVNITNQTIRPTVVDGGSASRVFENRSSGVTIQGITIRNGGGNSTATGGGVLNAGGLTIRNTSIQDNFAQTGGGLATEGASTTSLYDVTIARNGANADGGGIAIGAGGQVTAKSVTIATMLPTSHSAAQGTAAGLFVAQNASLTTRNTLISGNEDESHEAPDCAVLGNGSLDSLGTTFIGNANGCSYNAGSGDVVNRSAQLLPPADNGGPSTTVSLRKTSPAIDAGQACGTYDQRGVLRSVGGRCDIGAWELARCGGVVINVVGSPAADLLQGTNGPDGIIGGDGNDTLRAFSGQDGLCGGAGNDRLEGGAKADLLDGGPGNDTCLGGGGADKQRRCETVSQIEFRW